MVVWSSFSRCAQLSSVFRQASATAPNNVLQICKRESSHGPKMMHITPSRFQFHKFKDMLHFFTMLGLIPIGAVVFYANVFVGPATMAPIPDGYEPKHWEYHRHPISRFLARYVYSSPQQEYEKYLHYLYEETDKARVRRLEKEVKDKMAERSDYQAYYYRPAMAKYHRISREVAIELEELRGD